MFSGYLFLLEDGDFVERNVWGQFVFETVDLDKLAVQFFLIGVELKESGSPFGLKFLYEVFNAMGFFIVTNLRIREFFFLLTIS